MAEASEKPPEQPKAAASSRIVGLLVNGAGVFALSLAAVILGGAVNAKLHPAQELILDSGDYPALLDILYPSTGNFVAFVGLTSIDPTIGVKIGWTYAFTAFTLP